MKNLICVTAVLLINCAPSAAPKSGNEELGIAEFVVTRTSSEARIAGLDAGGEVVGELVLRRGRVELLDDTGDIVDGLSLVAEFEGAMLKHASEGRRALELPLLGTGAYDLDAFVSDPHVAALLAEWNVKLSDRSALSVDTAPGVRATREDAYAGCSYSGCSANYTTSCCQEGSGANTYETRTCADTTVLITRHCPGPGGSSPCGAVGSGGCVVCGQTPSSNEWYIYHNGYDGVSCEASTSWRPCAGVDCGPGYYCYDTYPSPTCVDYGACNGQSCDDDWDCCTGYSCYEPNGTCYPA